MKQTLVKIWGLKYQKLFKPLIISIFQGIYYLAHKTLPLVQIGLSKCGFSYCEMEKLIQTLLQGMTPTLLPSAKISICMPQVCYKIERKLSCPNVTATPIGQMGLKMG
jgi:hypothetical protein